MFLPRRPLSNKASTASWSIRFSFWMIIDGALKSISFFKRLLRLITLLYKSFKSDVANLPPSNWIIGLSSGGITGRASKIIHSGRLPDSRNASKTSKRLIKRTRFWLDESLISSISFLIVSTSFCKSTSFNNSLMASAPIPTLNVFPYFS